MKVQKHSSVQDAWEKLAARYPFEWWTSLSFEYPVSQEVATKRLSSWVRSICVEEHLQVGYIAVFNETRRIHGHALMFGRNREGKTLLNVSMKRWATDWWKNNCGSKINWDKGARIRPVYDMTGVSKYFSKNITLKTPDLSDVSFYNGKLLRKYEIKRNQNAVKENHPVIVKQSSIKRDKDKFDKQAVRTEMLSLIEKFHAQ
jgi:hypothetical protein